MRFGSKNSVVQDPRLFWDLIKYKIQEDTISYAKCKARERKAKVADLEKKIEKHSGTMRSGPIISKC